MTNIELLYRKLNALRLEVDESIVDDIKATVDEVLAEQKLMEESNLKPLIQRIDVLMEIIRRNEEQKQSADEEIEKLAENYADKMEDKIYGYWYEIKDAFMEGFKAAQQNNKPG